MARSTLAQVFSWAKINGSGCCRRKKTPFFVRETDKALRGIKELYNRSITGVLCLWFINKEGGPAVPEKGALSPVKLHALRNAFDLHVDAHPTAATKAERQRCVNMHLADMLKALLVLGFPRRQWPPWIIVHVCTHLSQGIEVLDPCAACCA
ncbi:hypothetical protein MRX96_037176 [Rhipicephalus microplus]